MKDHYPKLIKKISETYQKPTIDVFEKVYMIESDIYKKNDSPQRSFGDTYLLMSMSRVINQYKQELKK